MSANPKPRKEREEYTAQIDAALDAEIERLQKIVVLTPDNLRPQVVVDGVPLLEALRELRFYLSLRRPYRNEAYLATYKLRAMTLTATAAATAKEVPHGSPDR